MKYIFLLIPVFLMIRCEKNPSTDENKVKGEWQLIRTEVYFTPNGPKITDRSSENIRYHFKSNGFLKISGYPEDESFMNGEYPYEFKMDYLSNQPIGEKIELVIINDIKYMYQTEEEGMSLSVGYMDGPIYVFKKK